MTTTHLRMPELTASQAQKHVTHNEALFYLDSLVQLAVLDKDLTAAPGAPTKGQRYIVAAGATGSWASKDDQVASYDGSTWVYMDPVEGWRAWVADENKLYIYDGASWVDTSGITSGAFNDGSITLLGINGATADATNRLSANTPGVLFNAETDDIQLQLNKATATDDGYLAIKTGFSTRLMLGTIGSDVPVLKVSPNGATFYDALSFDTANSGRLTTSERIMAGSLGSAAIPTFTFSGDNDTGIYRAGANQLGFSTGGTLRLTLTTAALTVASSITSMSATSTNISALYLGLGGATADATNRFSINTGNLLLNNAGAGIDMTFNKNAAGNDASLSFKTGFSSYAIIGLLADNDLTIKVGASFLTAIKISNTTGEGTHNYPLILDGQSALPSAPPPGALKFYARYRAGTQWLDVQRSSGRDFPLQPHLGVNRLGWWAPSIGTTINTNGIPRTVVGTASTPAITMTSLSTSMRRWRVTSAATAASVSDERSATNVCWRGNAPGLGGFTYINRLSLTTIQADSTAFFGLLGSTAALSTSLTTAGLTNCIGIGFTRPTDTNWQILHNDGAGAPTQIDLGASFPINSTTNVLTLTIVAAPNGSDVTVRVVEEVSGTVHESTISSNIPASTRFLSVRNYMNNGATAAAVAYDCSGVYIETDF